MSQPFVFVSGRWRLRGCGFVLVAASMLVRTHAEEISSSQLAAVWDATKVAEVRCKFEYEFQRKQSQSNSPFGRNDSANTAINDSARGVFSRHNELGMLLDLGDRTFNLLDGIGKSIKPPTNRREGFSQVVLDKEGETMVQSHALTSRFLSWLDPLATRLCTRIAEIHNAKFPIVEDAELGNIIRVDLGGQSSTVAILSEQSDWRIIRLVKNRGNSPVQRISYEFGRLNGLPRLVSASWSSFATDGRLEIASKLHVKDVVFKCGRSDLELPTPPASIVYDQTKYPPAEYIIKADGSQRTYDREELRLAGSFKRIASTRPGELYSQNDSSRRYFFILIGVAIVGAGILMAFRSSNKNAGS